MQRTLPEHSVLHPEPTYGYTDDDMRAFEAQIDGEYAALLPGPYYMDPPDGGSITALEQLQRMAEDARKWREQGTSDGTVAVDKTLLTAVCAEIRKYAIPAGADDQVVLNLECYLSPAQQEPAKAPTYADVDAVVWRIQERKEAASATDAEHVLYTDKDKDRPDVICDGNGQVVLGLCKRCGKGECELVEACTTTVMFEIPPEAIAAVEAIEQKDFEQWWAEKQDGRHRESKALAREAWDAALRWL